MQRKKANLKGVLLMCQYAVVDLEMCKVPNGAKKGKYRWKHETIQIGAVLLNESLEIIDKFSTYVFPQFGFIDTYINKLTGISSANVCNAPNIEEALKKFVNWLPNDIKAVSWSRNDELQIRHEIEAKDIRIEGLDVILDNWIDCQKTFGKRWMIPLNVINYQKHWSPQTLYMKTVLMTDLWTHIIQHFCLQKWKENQN